MVPSLKNLPRVVGSKHLLRALDAGKVARIYVAQDADNRVLRGVLEKARDQGLPIVEVSTMKELGSACGIEVGTAACGLLRE